MQGLSVETPRVTQLAGGVTWAGEGLAREIGAATGLLDQIQAGWQSSTAAPRFVQVMQAHLEQATVLKDALLSHGAGLVTAAGAFNEAETAITGSLQGG